MLTVIFDVQKILNLDLNIIDGGTKTKIELYYGKVKIYVNLTRNASITKRTSIVSNTPEIKPVPVDFDCWYRFYFAPRAHYSPLHRFKRVVLCLAITLLFLTCL